LLCYFGVSDLCVETYTVTYAPNGADEGSVPFDSSEYQEGDTVTALTNTGGLVLSGYSFDGWNTAANGAGTSYGVGAMFAIAPANVTLYAQWSSNPTYTVTYDANGASSGSVPSDSTAYQQGTTVTVLSNPGNLSRTGYLFIGWNTAANGSGTSYTTAATFTMGSSNVTLYAQWSLNPTYTVTYNGNGASSGSVPVDSMSYENGTTLTVLNNTGNLARTGYSFTGWNTAANGFGTSRPAGTTFTIGSSNVTLYASWSLNEYSLQFDGVDDRVNIGDISALRTPSKMSVSFWFKRDSDKPGNSNHGTSNVMYAKASNPYNDNIEIGTDGPLVEIYLHTSTSDGSSAPGNTQLDSFDAGITNDTWYHLVFTYDSSVGPSGPEGRLYIDGTEVKVWYHWGGLLVSSSGSPLTIGNTDHIETPFDGLIDDIAIWNTAIYSNEVASIFGGASPSSTSSSNLLKYWSLDEGSGLTIIDHISGDNNGDVLNGTSWSTDTP
jgi:uncharacterized repeat protein (TIGR02543 family)